MRRLQAPAGHEPGIDQHQHRAFCPAISETSTYVQMCAAAQPLCGRVETVWVQPQSFDDGRQPESRSSQLTGGPQSIDWGNRVVHMDLRFADSTARAWFTGSVVSVIDRTVMSDDSGSNRVRKCTAQDRGRESLPDFQDA